MVLDLKTCDTCLRVKKRCNFLSVDFLMLTRIWPEQIHFSLGTFNS